MNDFMTCQNQEIVILTSSGMDSLLLTSIALKNKNIVYPLFISSCFLWEDCEWETLKRIIIALANENIREAEKIVVNAESVYYDTWMSNKTIPQWENGILTNTIIGRNICLLTFAFMYAASKNINNVVLGITSHSYLDAQKDFLDAFARALNCGLSRKIKLYYPLPSLSKEQIVEFIQKNLNIPWHLSFSCYNPINDAPCRNCYKCTETREKRENWQIKMSN